MQTTQYHSNPRLRPDQQCWRSWSRTVLRRPTKPSRINTQKRCPFHYRGLECKIRKSRDTWSNRQIWPWSTKWSKSKANSFIKRIHWSWQTPSSNNIKEDSTCGHQQMVNTKIRLIIFFAGRDKEALYSQQKQERSWPWLRSWFPFFLNINLFILIGG